jgi:hypothetical protein
MYVSFASYERLDFFNARIVFLNIPLVLLHLLNFSQFVLQIRLERMAK